MPYIDFGRAFANPEEKTPSASSTQEELSNTASPVAPVASESVKPASRPRFDRSHWANRLFVATIFVGGLFCAFYLFDGANLMRATAAWPREFLHSRRATIRLSQELTSSDEEALVPRGSRDRAATDHGDPFSRSPTALTLTPEWAVVSSGAGTGLPITASSGSTSSPLHQIGFAAPGGDALIQAFHRGVAELGSVGAPANVTTVSPAPHLKDGKRAAADEAGKR